jgi:hypothetical protein
LISAGATSQTTQRSLLLVCSDNATLESLSHADVRKLFLGVPITKNQIRLKPLLNASDSLVTEVFLQQIVFMSKREYQRQLLSRVFRLGDQRPPEYENVDDLAKALLDTPGSVSYMWSEQLEHRTGLKSLGVLWTDSNN